MTTPKFASRADKARRAWHNSNFRNNLTSTNAVQNRARRTPGAGTHSAIVGFGLGAGATGTAVALSPAGKKSRKRQSQIQSLSKKVYRITEVGTAAGKARKAAGGPWPMLHPKALAGGAAAGVTTGVGSTAFSAKQQKKKLKTLSKRNVSAFGVDHG